MLMALLSPAWLLLLIPLAAAMLLWKPPSRLLTGLRMVLLVFVVLAMCDPVIQWASRAGTVIVIADRSYSMPADSLTRQSEVVDFLHKAMPGEDALAVLSFGEKWALDKTPSQPQFVGFVSSVGQDGSLMTEAVEAALALIPRETPGRILLLSDGKWTGKQPSSAAAQAGARNIAIDYRILQRSTASDTAITQIDAPQTVTPGEAFVITAWIHSPVQQEVSYELSCSGQTIVSGSTTAPTGMSRLVFRDRAVKAGVRNYTVRINSSVEDPIPENNTARLLVGVEGPRAILCVSPTSDSQLAALLSRGQLDVVVATGHQCSWTLEELANYSAVILENVPAGDIGESAMENLTEWVRASGAGLMLTGGQNSYGPGGYYQSPLEKIMPVSMELRREHRKLSLAIVIALDRSGSMSAPVGLGKTKMDLANLASAEVLELLSPIDELGVVAVDSSPHVIAECRPVADNPRLREKILNIDSMGGGIFVYTALYQAAQMISEASAGTKHIILFSDAADSEEPGDYKELLANLRRAGITVSVIGLGTEADVDANFLKDIAVRGEGRIFFTTNPEELPRLFAQDTFVVARSTFIEDPTPVRVTGGMLSLTPRQFSEPPLLGGYNLCYLREGANLAVVTTDEYAAPVVANWQVGIGRTLCYTGEADGQFTGPIAGWGEVGDFFSSLARWTAGEAGGLGDEVLTTHRLEKGVCRVQLHLDPEREAEPFSTLPRVITLKGPAGAKPSVEEDRMHWLDADTLELEIPLTGTETALSTVDIASLGATTLSPVCLPYSPEFTPVSAEEGKDALEELAEATGGEERIELASIWEDLPKQKQAMEIGHFLALAAMVVFLLEILERRTGILSARGASQPVPEATQEEPAGKPVRSRSVKHVLANVLRRTSAKGMQDTAVRVEQKPSGLSGEDKAPPSEKQPDMLGALRKAQHRARDRRV